MMFYFIEGIDKRIVAERKKREAEEDKVFEEENYKERSINSR